MYKKGTNSQNDIGLFCELVFDGNKMRKPILLNAAYRQGTNITYEPELYYSEIK